MVNGVVVGGLVCVGTGDRRGGRDRGSPTIRAIGGSNCTPNKNAPPAAPAAPPSQEAALGRAAAAASSPRQARAPAPSPAPPGREPSEVLRGCCFCSAQPPRAAPPAARPPHSRRRRPPAFWLVGYLLDRGLGGWGGRVWSGQQAISDDRWASDRCMVGRRSQGQAPRPAACSSDAMHWLHGWILKGVLCTTRLRVVCD